MYTTTIEHILKNTVELRMDDENYFLLHNEFMFANHGLHTSDPNAVPPEDKFKHIQKF